MSYVRIIIALFAGMVLTIVFLEHRKASEEIKLPIATEEEARSTNLFTPVAVQGKAVAVYDLETESFLYSHNSNSQLPLASITKVMTAIAALDSIDPATVVHLKEGDVTLHDAIIFMLVRSSNSAAESIARTVESQTGVPFSMTMNASAKKRNLATLYFINASGLDSSTQFGGGYGSAEDVARLFGSAVFEYPEIFAYTTKDQIEIETGTSPVAAKNTNQEITAVPGALGSKTGLTDLAGGNLVVAFEVAPGHPIVLVSLGSDEAGRFVDIENLLDATITHFGGNSSSTVGREE